jgi:hypothetical protein
LAIVPADRTSVLPEQTGLLDVALGAAGIGLTTTTIVLGELVHPLTVIDSE